MTQTTFQFDPQWIEDDLNALKAFGWRVVSKKTANGLVKVVAERDDTTELSAQLAAIEQEYRDLERKTNELLATMDNLPTPGKCPEWKHWTTDRGHGSFLVYYGDYEPVTFWNIVFLVPPFILFGLPLLIVKVSKNKKSKKKYQAELDAYNASLNEYNALKNQYTTELEELENAMYDLVDKANELHG